MCSAVLATIDEAVTGRINHWEHIFFTEVRVEFVATGRGENCGIASYTSALQAALPVGSTRTALQLHSWNVLHYIRGAIRAGRTNADVIHVQHEYGIFGPGSVASWPFLLVLWALASLRGLPVVITLHESWDEDIAQPPLARLKWAYVLANNRLLAATADQLVFLSAGERDRFVDSTPAADPVVIPHGVPTDVRPMDREQAKERFSIDPDNALVVEPGYVRPEKGHDTFLAVAKRLPDIDFLIGGGVQVAAHEAYLDRLRAMAPENVGFTGILEEDDFHALLSAMDVALLPYESGSQSGVVNWCLAYGVPIVASDRGHFRDLAAQGVARTFPPEDPSAGADAVRSVLEDPEGVSAAVISYREQHGLASVARDHVALYKQLCGNRGSLNETARRDRHK
jgi:glycosyltransferase involved in cell wall biosynthesis